ncbi:MAG: M81 family metallopeptidase [Chloroflexota bacterium]
MRIAIGTLAHEANSFSPHAADWADFEAGRLAYGADAIAGWQGTNSELAGAMGILTADAQVELTPLLLAKALSCAPLRAAVARQLQDELIARLRQAGPVDGVLLILHGAMMAADEPDVTGALLAQVRAAVGPAVPVVGTLDLHANVTARMAHAATALIGYHTAPHVDMFQAGETAARLLLATIRHEVAPRMALVRIPMLLPPENSTHNWLPWAAVIDQALAWEREGVILHGGVYPVQPWLDAEDVASAVVVVTDGDAAKARAWAAALANDFWARRAEFVAPLVPPEAAVQRALARAEGTVVLCDSADSTTSGSTGDSTAILAAVLRGWPADQVALLNVVDPDAVAQAIAAGVGAPLSVPVGGKLAPAFFAPVAFEGTVKTISDGVFRHKGPGARGALQRMGRTVVLVCGGVHLVVMERAVSQWDPQLYRSLGEEPADARIVQLKSPMAFRAAYESIAAEIILVQAPGAANPDLRALPWRRLRRPIYPLDPEMTWSV